MQDSRGSSAVTDRVLHPEFSWYLEFSGLVQKRTGEKREESSVKQCWVFTYNTVIHCDRQDNTAGYIT